ncbi:hypothetical protein COY32_04685 [candidate division WWE3 bacterium CG_4_10_14_0_2_um_filter_41_14]|uniref:Uncharacterized protein n=1 Tax=candidate division WWE3 bacterium CG_4_10_14_0_2_um_filter_41_14 TaxID=1975072 RepID=A0A2M7THL9_UNCKA|nr:MAG: hypothetical protein COY32_04685 [candidate division WWE3 bacterium CG_4_10_14_0_2_um_filter_41_14]
MNAKQREKMVRDLQAQGKTPGEIGRVLAAIDVSIPDIVIAFLDAGYEIAVYEPLGTDEKEATRNVLTLSLVDHA